MQFQCARVERRESYTKRRHQHLERSVCHMSCVSLHHSSCSLQISIPRYLLLNEWLFASLCGAAYAYTLMRLGAFYVGSSYGMVGCC